MSLYDENQAPAVDPAGEQNPAQGPSEVDQLLAGIKNEQGEQKYANLQEALKGLAHSQDFINTLKAENAEMSGKLKSQEELAAMLQPQNPGKQDEGRQEPQQVAPSLTPEQVLDIVNQRDKKNAADANVNKVKAQMQAKFGAEYNEVLAAKTQELGLTPGLVDTMAGESPEALLKLFGVEETKPQKSNFNNAVNPEKLNGEKPAPKKFDPYAKAKNKGLDAWLASKERTNARLGLA